MAILGLVAVGFLAFGGERVALRPALDRPPSLGLLAAFGAALVPVLFAYGGWQTSSSVMGRYEQILNYVVSVDFIAMGLTGAALFVYRRRGEVGAFRAPGHPWTTAFFVLSCWAVVVATIHRYPGDSVIGLSLLALGLPVYRRWKRPAGPSAAGSPSRARGNR